MILYQFRIEKEPCKSEVDNEVSDVSSNELSGPEDGECESDKGNSTSDVEIFVMCIF